MNMFLRLFPTVVILAWCSSCLAGSVGKLAIVQKDPSAIEKRAADEFLNFAEKLVGRSGLQSNPVTVYIGAGPKILKALPGGSGSAIKIPGKPESFLIKSLKTSNGRKLLLIAGSDGPGTLYGVYHYLEEVAGCGFYQDGDYIPSISKLPVDGIGIARSPRFKYRFAPLAQGAKSLAKFDATYWPVERFKRRLDWMAKRKLNMMDWNTIWYNDLAGTVPYKVFPEIGQPKPQPRYQAGVVATWIWPPEYRDKWIKEIFAYARGLGIKIYYNVDWGNVPTEFVDAHPGVKVIMKSVYGHSFIDPYDPITTEVMSKYIRTFTDQFGNDNIYHCAPYAEEAPGGDVEATVRLKVKSATELYNAIQKISPESTWLMDSWDFNYPWWSKEAIKQFFEGLPKDMKFFIYDVCSAEFTPRIYKYTDYFCGRDWAFGSLHSYGGDDVLHGNIDNLFRRVQEVTHDPKATRLIGLWHNPEIIMDNVLYSDFIHHLAFDPDEFDTIDSYLDYYTKHRYGSKAYDTLRPAVSDLVNAVYMIAPMHKSEADPGADHKYTTIVNWWIPNPFYQFPYLDAGGIHSFPVSKDGERWIPFDKERLNKMAPLLKEAIAGYLKAEDVCRENKLYENDLIDMARTYLGMRFNLGLIDTYERFKAGDRQGMEQGMLKCRATMEAVEKLLSTRPDFSLQKMIDDVMKVPGTNPYTPEMLKEGNVWWDYNTRDCYELMHFWYRPRVEVYFDLLRQRIDAGQNAVSIGDIKAALKQANLLQGEDRMAPRQFLNQDIRLPESNAYKGTTLQAVRQLTSDK